MEVLPRVNQARPRHPEPWEIKRAKIAKVNSTKTVKWNINCGTRVLYSHRTKKAVDKRLAYWNHIEDCWRLFLFELPKHKEPKHGSNSENLWPFIVKTRAA